MTKRMLIDATHPEETRVAVVSGSKLEEYDYETLVRKQLKSNIYLVKVTRVEPSLQAAFVDFGGNRHGFLPFPEIHPDYYRIPIADRQALLAEERALAAAQAAKEEEEDAAALAASGEEIDEDEAEEQPEDPAEDEDEEAGADPYEPAFTGSIAEDISAESVADEEDEEVAEAAPVSEEGEEVTPAAEEEEEDPDVETVGGDVVETPVYRSSIKRRYKIQEVIKRNQIMLIQISKEERGNKGAAVTSYISLPGRYCVLMPNSPRGGGVSRKVSNLRDRHRLKKILAELNVPEGMSVILRTAGVSRSHAEIKRDLDYLLRLWDQIRELTLKSTAPALIYEEGNLVKRAIRDLYRRDIDEVHVAGEEAFQNARDFMKTLMPSHAERIKLYQDDTMPLFIRYQVEKQIDEIHNPTMHLKSGGYIVINPTEAMVSVDVNSGRATKGRHIEETALKTNLEAAEEIARQLRLRDLGGLVVIDFIDMEDRRNNRIVEKRLRDAMQNDRARIQLGRISAFGLLELSRQRLHPSLVETNFETCAHCKGVGVVRTVETTAVMILRAIEEEGLRARSSEIKVGVPTEVALYIFNNKREMLNTIEKRHDIRVFLNADDKLIKPNYTLESTRSGAQKDNRPARPAPVQSVDMSDVPDIPPDQITDDSTVSEDFRDEDSGNDRGHRHSRHSRHEHGDGGEGGERRRNRRGGRRRGGRGRNRGDRPYDANQPQPSYVEQPGLSADIQQPIEGGQPQAEGGEQQQRHHGGGRHRRDRHRGRHRHGGGDRQPQQQGDNGQPQAQPSAPSPSAATPQHYAAESTAPSPANESDDGPVGPGRKGWWKRLTE